MSKQESTAYVLLSGGQDSFACVVWALEHFTNVEAISIHYEQKHKKEISYARKIADHFSIDHYIYELGDFFKSIAQSSLLNNTDHNTKHAQAEHLPASFVPNRNGIFLTIASNHAYKKTEKHIHLVTGTCQTDYSGYPDCRDVFIKAKEVELSLGLDCPVSIHTPLMWLTKAETFVLAKQANKLNEMNSLTLTCYNGVEDLNEWGRGCGSCPSCKLRKQGYLEFIQNEV